MRHAHICVYKIFFNIFKMTNPSIIYYYAIKHVGVNWEK